MIVSSWSLGVVIAAAETFLTASRLVSSVASYLYYFIENCTTNLAECWMHICAKFDGGKQINRSQRGSWEGRCIDACLHLNEGSAWGPTSWEKAVSVPANTVYKSYATTLTRVVEQDRKRKSTQQAKLQRKKSKTSFC